MEQKAKGFSIMRTSKLLFISCVLGVFISSVYAADGIDYEFHGKNVSSIRFNKQQYVVGW
jgi:hypothetical protein